MLLVWSTKLLLSLGANCGKNLCTFVFYLIKEAIMAKECDMCGKKPVSGHNVSHSNIKTKRRFMPNLQSVRLTLGGTSKKVKLCTSCLKTYAQTLAA